jgi:anti-sigma regulatory factor (Ser/Thr protein kinase)
MYPSRPLIVSLRADRSAAFVGRRLVEDNFADLGAADVEDAKLLVSELVTNAVLYGTQPIFLRLAEWGDELRVEVEDAKLEMSSPREGSRGLQIVDRLARDWGVTFGGACKTVWAVLALHARNGGS